MERSPRHRLQQLKALRFHRRSRKILAIDTRIDADKLVRSTGAAIAEFKGTAEVVLDPSEHSRQHSGHGGGAGDRKPFGRTLAEYDPHLNEVLRVIRPRLPCTVERR